jgi:UDP-N-acetylglucosamine diphosphorylase/glucosamine-1-phosphate N-acetyltransferase
MASLVIFDDGRGSLGPLTDLRAAFDVRTGALTTRERIERTIEASAVALWAPAEVGGLVEGGGASVNDRRAIEALDEALVVNGRCAAPPAQLGLLERGEAVVESSSGEVVAARLDGGAAASVCAGEELSGDAGARETDSACLLHHPEDVIRFRDEAVASDLTLLRAQRGPSGHDEGSLAGVVRINEEAMWIDPGARVMPGSVLDAEKGPIVIEAGATIRPRAVIVGPAYVGEHCVIAEHALIKGPCAFGAWCKVGGEIGGTIFQSFSNKVHDGHLGDSWVGSWVNLGAATVNSNLLNTYGEVTIRSEADGRRRRTGLTFLGSLIGDHVKTAIGTRLMTGAVVGTGSMIAVDGAAPTFVDRFTWLTNGGSSVYRIDRMLETARAMMARRKVEMSAAEEKRLRALCEARAVRAQAS